jgi:hypothetical protein
MAFWIYFWTAFFVTSLVVFAILAVVVSVGGFFDIRSLFKSLTGDEDSQANDAGPNAR